MTKERKPPGGRTGKDDYDPWGHAEVFAMTVRHGTEVAKRYYDRLYAAEGHPDETER